MEGRHVVIIGRGVTIGRPLANLLTLKQAGLNAAVSVVHTGVDAADMAAITRTADIVVAAAGRPHLLTPDMVKPGAAVVSAGTTLRGQEADSRRSSGRGRGGRLDHAPARWGWTHDSCHAVAQRSEGG